MLLVTNLEQSEKGGKKWNHMPKTGDCVDGAKVRGSGRSLALGTWSLIAVFLSLCRSIFLH